ncbi:MAG: MATE family efflux transporter [Thermoguttaceae bacterium]|nr:MATE family efflux transporter [Thermoguttaceae bacterium]
MTIERNPEFLENRPVPTLLWQFSLPAITASLVSATYNFVARIFVGQQIGTIGITALTVSFPVIVIFLAFAMMIGTGATTLLSIRLGERDYDRAEQILGLSLFLYVLLYILFLFFGLCFLSPLLRFFGATEEAFPYAKSYLSVIICGTLFQLISFGVNNFIRAEGHPHIAMFSMLISAAVNIFLDWLFLCVFKFGIWGAALSNNIALFISSLWICWLYFSGKTVLKWRLKYFRPNFRLMRKIIIFGTVPFAMQLCSAIVQTIQNRLFGYYGEIYGQIMNFSAMGLTGENSGSNIAIGVTGTVFTISMVAVMPILGLSQGAQPIVGYNVGARRPDRVHQTLIQSLKIGAAIGILFWVATIIRPDWFLRLFVRQENNIACEQIMNLGVYAVRLMFFCLPLVTINIICSGYFQAHGRPLLSLMLTLLRQLLFLLPLLYVCPVLFQHLFGRQMGIIGCWFAFSASDFCAFCVTFTFLLWEFRLKKTEIAHFHQKKKAANLPDSPDPEPQQGCRESEYRLSGSLNIKS